MKSKFTNWLLFLFAASFLASCVKDKCTRTYTFYVPVYKTTDEVRANIKSNAPRKVERPGKLFVLGNYIFLNEMDRGVHVIDNANPSAPKNVAFIDMPGNIDLAVKGNTLYADAYTDLVTLDITNPLQVAVKSIKGNAFPFRRYTNGFVSDNNKVIVDWVKKDTTVVIDCNGGDGFLGCRGCFVVTDAAFASTSKTSGPFGAGIAGSMARFSIVSNYLYTVSDRELKVFSISNAADPQFIRHIDMGWGIETIYPFKDKLFIGSNTGMFIYGLQNPSFPNQLGTFSHVRTCDPVIADDKYAYVTLRSGNICTGFTNQMEVLDIANLSSPVLVKTYPLFNPHGLSKDGNTLFICDGKEGLKIFNASLAHDIRLVKQIKDIETYDVIAYNNLALVVAKDGLYQFDYADLNNVRLLSKIGYQQ
ncbi:MAG TPA: hypothetical protein VD993_06140 [Chitinophagaceae bacterium]|nr:hypothetical protein [Chitinophagaceae bacterium]